MRRIGQFLPGKPAISMSPCPTHALARLRPPMTYPTVLGGGNVALHLRNQARPRHPVPNKRGPRRKREPESFLVFVTDLLCQRVAGRSACSRRGFHRRFGGSGCRCSRNCRGRGTQQRGPAADLLGCHYRQSNAVPVILKVRERVPRNVLSLAYATAQGIRWSTEIRNTHWMEMPMNSATGRGQSSHDCRARVRGDMITVTPVGSPR